MTTRTVAVNFMANVQPYVAGVGKAVAATGAFAKSAVVGQGGLTGLAKTMLPVNAALLGAGGLVFGLREAWKTSSEFGSAILKLQTQIGMTADEANHLADAAMNLTGATITGPTELAEAIYFIAGSGLEGAAAMDALTYSARLARLGLGETELIADALTSVMNAYGTETISAAEASDILMQAVNLGKAEADEFAGAISRVLPVASAMGVQFDEVGGVIAALTLTGTSAEEAVTQLRAIMLSILSPAEQSKDALHEFGLTAEGLQATIRNDGLWAAMQELQAATGGNSEAFAQIFPNVRAFAGAMDLLGPQLENNTALMAEMANSAGVADAAFATFALSTSGEIDALGSEFERFMIEAGNRTDGFVYHTVRSARSLTTMFADIMARNENEAAFTEARMRDLRVAIDSVTSQTEGLTGRQLDAAKQSDSYKFAVQQLEEAYRRLGSEQQIAIFGEEMYSQVISDQIQGQEDYIFLLDGTVERYVRLADAVGNLPDHLTGYADGTNDIIDTLPELQESLGMTTEEFEAQAKAIDSVREAQLALIDPVYAAIQAERDLREAQAELADADIRVQTLPGDLAAAESELAAARSQNTAMSNRLAAAEARLQQLEEAGLKGTDEYSAARDELSEAKDGDRDASRRLSDAQATLNDLTAEAAALDDRLVDAVFDVMIAETERTAALDHAGMVTDGYLGQLSQAIDVYGLNEDAIDTLLGRLSDLGIEVSRFDVDPFLQRMHDMIVENDDLQGAFEESGMSVDDFKMGVILKLKEAEAITGEQFGNMIREVNGYEDSVEDATEMVGDLAEAQDDIDGRQTTSTHVHTEIRRTIMDGVQSESQLSSFERALLRGEGIPGRAMGGPVNASQPYIVGEQGPELFVPAIAGNIMTAAQTSDMMSQPSGPGIVIEQYHAHRTIDNDLLVAQLEWAQEAGRL